MNSKLPIGWELTPLGTLLIRISNGYSQAQADEQEAGYLPITRIETIASADFNLNRVKYVPAPTNENLEHFRLQVGDILFSHINSDKHLGKTAYFDLDDVLLLHGINLLLLRFDNTTTSKYIHYLLTLYRAQGRFMDIAQRAVNQSSINQKKLQALEVPLAPLAEQRRIVAQLEAVMQKLEASQARLEKLPMLLKKFRQAVLAAAVSGKLTEAWRAEHKQGEAATALLARIQKERREWAIREARKGNLEASRFYKKAEAQLDSSAPEGLPEGWSQASLLKVCQLMVDCHNKTAPYISEGIPLVRTTNIKKGRLLLDSVKYVSHETYRFWSKRCPPESGDILFTREAPMGESAMIPPDTTLCMGQRMMLLRFFKDLSEAQFFGYVLQSPSFLNQIGESAVGTGVLHLRVGDVEALQVPVPPLAEQQEIARQVSHYFSLADQLEARFEQAATMVEQLPQALLAKAFSGELVPQDPNEEPASALLERLKTEAPAPEKGQRRKKTNSQTTLFS